jgi:pyruvate dehydrogenase E2 component (dihydrolipoamide acetyltransferase)
MPTPILMPALSPSMKGGRLIRWRVKPGDTLAAGDVIAEIDVDNTVMAFESDAAGRVLRLLVTEGSEAISVDTPIALLLAAGDTPPDASSETGAPIEALEPAVPGRGRRFASPLARRLAEEHGVDLNRLTGSGPRGRITAADVRAPAAPTASAADRAPRLAEPESLRDATPNRAASDHSPAWLCLRRELRLDALRDCRAQGAGGSAGGGLRLTISDFIVKACADALLRHPAARVIRAGDRLQRVEQAEIALQGLGGAPAPVLRTDAALSLSALAQERRALAARAAAQELTAQERQGGTLALCNLGALGVDSAEAWPEPPQVVLLAVGRARPRPVVLADGGLGVATTMALSLSLDARAIDAALGAALLGAITEGLEDPWRLLA